MDEYIGITRPLKVIDGASANLDAKYGPYDSINHAISEIPISIRRIGLTVGIIFIESSVETVKDYWWKRGIEDEDLELKIDNAAPTKTSQLENDADFQDGNQVAASLQAQKNILDAVDLSLQDQISTINQKDAIQDNQIQNIITSYIDNKGYFASLASLQTSYPTPQVGDTAYVANASSSTGYYIYNVVNGVWTASTVEAPSVSVPINDYVTKTSIKQVTGNSEIDLMSQKAVTDELALKADKTELDQLAGDVNQKIEVNFYEDISANPIEEGISFIVKSTGLTYRVREGQTLEIGETPESQIGIKTDIVAGQYEIVNEAPNGGNFLAGLIPNVPNIEILPSSVKVTGTYTWYNFLSFDVNTDMYVAFPKSTTTVSAGTILFRYRKPDTTQVSQSLIAGKNYFIPKGSYEFTLTMATDGSTVELSMYYAGTLPYVDYADITDKVVTQENYYQNNELYNFNNVVLDDYGNKKLRINGDDTEKSISIDFDKTNSGDIASVLFKSSVSLIKITKSYLSDNDAPSGTVTSTSKIKPDTPITTSFVFDSASNRLRITITFTGTSSDYLEVYSPAITKANRYVSDVLVPKQINGDRLTSLVNDKPINLLPNNGDIRYNNYLWGEYEVDGDYIKIKSSTTAQTIQHIAPVSYQRYVAITDAVNITGSPRIGFRVGNNIFYRDLIVNKSYATPANTEQIVILTGVGGSVSIKSIYLGDKPYHENWVEQTPPKTQDNYYPNPHLNGFENRVEDNYGNPLLRITGDGTPKSITVLFDKTNDGDYFSLLFKSSVHRVEVTQGFLTAGGGGASNIISDYFSFPNMPHVVGRAFLEEYPTGRIIITFTGTPSDYLEVYSPAITKEVRNVSDVLINKSKYSSSGGIEKFETLTDAILSNPEGIIQVGQNLLSRKIENPVNKSDYSLISSNSQPQLGEMGNIRYVDTGTLRLMLITTKKRYIFTDATSMYFTDNLEECLVPTVHATEKRFTIDESKLTPFHNVHARGVREMGDGEVIIMTYGDYFIYSTENQTVFNTSNVFDATVGSRIDGWAFDAYGDTVVMSTYSPSPDYGNGSVLLSYDYGRTFNEVMRLEEDMSIFGGEIPHLHGCFIDGYRETIFLMVGDYTINANAPGKILVLRNYKSNTQWEILPHNFREGIREQYCTGIALEKCILFGTDMHETCVARMNIGDKGYNSKREWADNLIIGLNYIPNFTRPVESGAPIGIHYSYINGTTPSSIVLTKDGFNFAKIYTDTVAHTGFSNNNARVWCDNQGNVCCVQFNGRFTNELILGKYNGFNMV